MLYFIKKILDILKHKHKFSIYYFRCEVYQESSDEAIEQVMNTNLMQLLWTTKALLPHMIKRKSGHIVVTASVGAFTGLPSMSSYYKL